MQYIPEKVTGVQHPLVNDMYLKKDMSRPEDPEARQKDVLVIETNIAQEQMEDEGDLEDIMIDFLGDLDELKGQAERRVGRVDKVDIRT